MTIVDLRTRAALPGKRLTAQPAPTNPRVRTYAALTGTATGRGGGSGTRAKRLCPSRSKCSGLRL